MKIPFNIISKYGDTKESIGVGAKCKVYETNKGYAIKQFETKKYFIKEVLVLNIHILLIC